MRPAELGRRRRSRLPFADVCVVFDCYRSMVALFICKLRCRPLLRLPIYFPERTSLILIMYLHTPRHRHSYIHTFPIQNLAHCRRGRGTMLSFLLEYIVTLQCDIYGFSHSNLVIVVKRNTQPSYL